jgi:hypothetical protein
MAKFDWCLPGLAQTDKDLVLKYYTISYTVQGKYLGGDANVMKLHPDKEQPSG